jgi:hypothetical protein
MYPAGVQEVPDENAAAKRLIPNEVKKTTAWNAVYVGKSCIFAKIICKNCLQKCITRKG